MLKNHLTFLTIAAMGVLLAGTMGGCPLFDIFFPPADPNTPDPNAPDPNEPNTPPPTEKTLHERIFTEIITSGFDATSACMICHSDIARDILDTGHWNWAGEITNIEGFEGETGGKYSLINNLCIAVPSNEGRCTMCHPSFGWKDNTFDFADTDNVDCLVCHDTTGTYKKHPTANDGGGPPAMVVDGVVTVVDASELQDVAFNVGMPSRANCLACHALAGGGDNVKHGDLSTDLNDPNEAQDYHMGALDYTCQECHAASDHMIAGTTALHSDEGEVSCGDCHNEEAAHTQDDFLASLLNLHTSTVACQTCHIPTFSRTQATKMEWYWDEAGEDRTDIPTQFDNPTYDKKKGRFVWDMNVTPTYMWFDGKWTRKVVNLADTYDEEGTVADPIVLAAPTATSATEGAKIHPFKKMIGRQPVDPVNQRLVVPHLFGTAGGDNPYWVAFDWGLAIEDGTTYAGQPYSGEYDFANTVMYLTINHEVAPKENALDCDNCHGNAAFWTQVGIEDPFGS